MLGLTVVQSFPSTKKRVNSAVTAASYRGLHSHGSSFPRKRIGQNESPQPVCLEGIVVSF